MKIQCSCGAKYAFDLAPEMAWQPIRFVCQTCGLDSSEFVNTLIRQELANSTTVASAPAPVPVSAPVMAQPAPGVAQAAPPTPRVARLHITTPAHRPAETASPDDPTIAARCNKHGELAAERCRVCSKPICPKCMELFGYVCSPLCKAKADSHGIDVPVFAGQKSVVEARLWRKVALVAGTVCLLVVSVLGVWFWYAWFGSVPKPIFSVRFAQPAYSGQSSLCGLDQIVFVHGDTLARHDMQQHNQIWSRQLVDMKQIEAEVEDEMKQMKRLIDKANNENPEHVPKMPDPEKLKRNLARDAAAALQLRVSGTNIWVSSPGKLVRYDWDTGNPVKEIALDEAFGRAIPRGDELLFMGSDSGKQVITHINLTTCDSRSEEIPARPQPRSFGAAPPKGKGPVAKASNKNPPPRSTRPQEMAGLPVGTPGKDAGKPLDPAKIADQAQHLPYAAKIALPAVLANSANQERTLAALDDQPRRTAAADDDSEPDIGDHFSLIPTKDGFVQFFVRLLERRVVTRSAMKAAPSKSVLEGNVTVGKTLEVANEILNDMQRSRGGDTVTEDESRYEVAVTQPNAKEVWRGEVVGSPSLLPLKTVNVVAANKTVIALDKTNKKLWQANLNYNIVGGMGGLEEGDALYGQGPCVEHKGTLYVFDQGVLTAFDLGTGNPRWRVPSVGIAGLFFDDKDMLYVNTTTASPDTIKYSRQIDVSQKVSSVILKLDSKTGKQLWSAQPGGLINHVSGKYLYCVQFYRPDESEDENPYSVETGFETRPYLRIKRINPANGKEMWEHRQERAPLDVQIDKNTIHLVFKKEVQVLRFASF